MHLWVNKKSFASAFCAGIKCLIYHKGQPSKKRKPKCTNCWGEHWRSQCSEKSGVASALKQIMNQDQRSVRLLSKTRNTSYPLPVPITHAHYQISFHVPYMFLESIIAPQNMLFNMLKPFAAEIFQRLNSAIQAAETALDAKMISKTIQINDEFIDKQEKLMKEIVNAKYDQVEAFREILDKQEQSTLFAESVYDDFWGSGLSKAGTEHTDHRKWPRQNILGQIFRKIISSRRPAPDPSLFLGICRQPHSVIFQTCWIRFGNPTKELISSRLLCKTTLGLRVNLCGPTGTKMRATKTPMSPLSEKNRWVRTMMVVSARS